MRWLMAVAYAVRGEQHRQRVESMKMGVELTSEQWFALQVKVRRERFTASLLVGKGYQTLLPTYRSQRRWSSQPKEISTPLFPGYVFCRFDALKRLPILVTPGVMAVVGRGRVPVPVEDSEISAIQTLVSSGLPLEPWPYLEVGQRVRIEDAALSGLEGILLGFKGSRRIIVSVSLLRRSVALEIERARVSPVRSTRAVAGSLSPEAMLGGAIA
jgi:transcriptional antiterminator NusG